MNKEKQLIYLYLLTKMFSGTKKWNKCYQPWYNYHIHLPNKEYEALMKKAKEFYKKYKN